MKKLSNCLPLLFLGIVILWAAGQCLAGYKARDWSPNARESYAARLTSEGVTIAAEPILSDALAERIFDKKDIVTRGIMPLAIVIFNDNDYPIEVDPFTIELIRGEERYTPLAPDEAVNRLFGKGASPLTGASAKSTNADALKDFHVKSLKDSAIPPHEKAAGFLYMRLYNPKDLPEYLSAATVYIPNVYRGDDGSKLIYFEIDLKAALKGLKRD